MDAREKLSFSLATHQRISHLSAEIGMMNMNRCQSGRAKQELSLKLEFQFELREKEEAQQSCKLNRISLPDLAPICSLCGRLLLLGPLQKLASHRSRLAS